MSSPHDLNEIRIDHIGSLVRPARLKELFARFDEVHVEEDRAVVVTRGLQVGLHLLEDQSPGDLKAHGQRRPRRLPGAGMCDCLMALAPAAARAQEAGATACLSVVPYYNKPTQEGQYLHFRKIAETVDLPMILYNVPGRTVADLQNDTVLRLAQVPGIIGIKDATASIERGTDLIRRAPRSFAIYSGEDSTALAVILLGGHLHFF